MDYVVSEEELLRLIELTKEVSYRMPQGLTREERREWMKQTAKEIKYLEVNDELI